MPIRILHIITDLSPDGAQRLLLRLVKSLPSPEFENRVVTLKKGGHLVQQFRDAGIVVSELGMASLLPGPLVMLWLRNVIKDYQPHIIHGWMYHAHVAATAGKFLAGSKAKLLWNVRRCLYERNLDKSFTRLMVSLNAKLSKIPDKIVYCVRVAAEQHEAIGFDPTKRVVITNGFDLSRLSADQSRRAWLRSELGISENTRLVGIAGRWHAQKNYPLFFECAAKVADALPDVHFILAGRGVDNSNPAAAELLNRYGHQDRFHLLGERQDLPAVFAGLDLYVSSSSSEGFSNVVAEAMACGVPCAVTDAGASRDLVQGLGAVAERNDAMQLTDGILNLLSLPPEELRAIGIRSRAKIVAEHTLESMINRYAAFYREVSG